MKLARVTIQPSFSCVPEKKTITLIKRKDKYQAKTIKKIGENREIWRKEIPSIEVITQLDKLRSATIPAFPISPSVCEGSYIELTIYGENSDLTLGWWTVAPNGVEEVADFADWLRKQELSDLDEAK